MTAQCQDVLVLRVIMESVFCTVLPCHKLMSVEYTYYYYTKTMYWLHNDIIMLVNNKILTDLDKT